ncbi:MAG: hypothetical protein IKI64_04470 [Clostridia bacterium]|nr:hypothetical protein [Clostridia bacterium]
MYKISFFSYKGGSGRSSTLVNIVPFLVKELKADSNHPIVLLDMDIDSTGLTYLLHQGENVGKSLSIQRIMVEGVPEGNRTKRQLDEHRFFTGLLKVGAEFNCEDGAVLLLPAEAGVSVGRDGTNMNMTHRDSRHIGTVIEVCERHDCAAIIFDSSAGDQETATISNGNADVIVCCMRPTIQFQEGTLDYFMRMNRSIRNKDVILVPNAVSKATTTVDDKVYPITAKLRIVDALRDSFPETGNTLHFDALEGALFGIPLVSRFLWKESILATLDQDSLAADEKEALEMYQLIACLIRKYGEKEE